VKNIFNKYFIRGIEVLNTPEPDKKVKLTLQEIDIINLPKKEYPVPLHPARPKYPILLSPQEMPKRSIGNNGIIPLVHALAHIELNAIDLAWDLIVRFGPKINNKEFYLNWYTVVTDEAKHFQLLNNQLISNKSFYGQLPAHNSLWEIASKTSNDILERLAVIPMFFEARGLDATPSIIKKLKSKNYQELCNILTTIYEDEINHLKIGVYWFEKICLDNKTEPIKEWKRIIEKHIKKLPEGSLNIHARELAGMNKAYWS
jgi:uncharacterized ferritin-like protein (DUF455 family)